MRPDSLLGLPPLPPSISCQLNPINFVRLSSIQPSSHLRPHVPAAESAPRRRANRRAVWDWARADRAKRPATGANPSPARARCGGKWLDASPAAGTCGQRWLGPSQYGEEARNGCDSSCARGHGAQDVRGLSRGAPVPPRPSGCVVGSRGAAQKLRGERPGAWNESCREGPAVHGPVAARGARPRNCAVNGRGYGTRVVARASPSTAQWLHGGRPGHGPETARWTAGGMERELSRGPRRPRPGGRAVDGRGHGTRVVARARRPRPGGRAVDGRGHGIRVAARDPPVHGPVVARWTAGPWNKGCRKVPTVHGSAAARWTAEGCCEGPTVHGSAGMRVVASCFSGAANLTICPKGEIYAGVS